ncbi:DUF1772 domain-containing protein [Dongia sp.]|uniref:anthrone oxygenase family protein n=1 Tax=Dongia sp. TaxID=1977262 RepID=UPI0035B4BE91
MLGTLIFPLTLILALGSGLIAGAFFAFSSFVMQALAKLPAPQGVAAMQSINIAVINPLFLGVFIGTALGAVLLAALAIIHGTPAMGPLLAGSALYVIGCFGVTIFRNVPLNNALAPLEARSDEAASLWTRYLKDWVMWNHVRTMAALAASGAFILALWGN